MVSVLRQAQIWALTGQTSGAIRYSYGARLTECVSNSCVYILFKDLNGNNLYDSGEEISGAEYNLIKGVYIETLSPQVSNNLDIIFEPPLSKIYFNNSVSQDSAQIVLGSSLTTDTKIITITRESGQIDIK